MQRGVFKEEPTCRKSSPRSRGASSSNPSGGGRPSTRTHAPPTSTKPAWPPKMLPSARPPTRPVRRCSVPGGPTAAAAATTTAADAGSGVGCGAGGASPVTLATSCWGAALARARGRSDAGFTAGLAAGLAAGLTGRPFGPGLRDVAGFSGRSSAAPFAAASLLVVPLPGRGSGRGSRIRGLADLARTAPPPRGGGGLLARAGDADLDELG